MLPDQKLSVKQLAPGIRYSRKAPVAAVLQVPLLAAQVLVLLAVDGRVRVLSVVAHSRYVEVNHRSCRPPDHVLQDAHLRRVGGREVLFVGYRLRSPCHRCHLSSIAPHCVRRT
jgi:hypothetical protein